MASDIKIKVDFDSKNAQKGLGGLDDKAKQTDIDLKALGKTAAVAFTAVAAGVAASVNEFAKFDNKMRGVKTLLDKNSFGAKGLEKGFREMTDEALRLSTQVPVGIDSLTTSLFDTISAGIDAGEAVKVLGVSSKLAVAGLTDVATATNGMTSALNAYSLGSEEAENVAAKFFIAQKSGITTIQQLADGFGVVGATAAATGVSLNELLGAVSAVTSAGVKTNSAYTGLKAVLSNILKPTADATKEAKRLGVEFNAGALRSKGFATFLGDLKNAAGFTQDSITKLFGSVEAQNIIFALAGNQAEKFADNLKKLGDQTSANGILSDAYETQSKGLQAQMTLLGNNIKRVAIIIGDFFSPAVATAISLTNDFLGALADSTTTAKQAETRIEKLSEKLGILKEQYENNKSALEISTGAMAINGTALEKQTEKTGDQIDEIEKLIRKQEEFKKQPFSLYPEDAVGQNFDDLFNPLVTASDQANAAIVAGTKKRYEEEEALKKAKADRDALAAIEERERIENELMQLEVDLLAGNTTRETYLQKRADIEKRAEGKSIKLRKAVIKSDEQLQTEFRRKQLIQFQKYNGDQVRIQALADAEKYKRQQQYANASLQLANNLASLSVAVSGKQNKTLFAIQKAAAIAQAVIATELGAAIALSTSPPPGNFALSALVRAAGYTGVGLIAATAIQGFAKGGMVEGGIPNQDSVPIMAQQGELVVPRQNFDEVINAVSAERETQSPVEIMIGFTDDAFEIIENKLLERGALGIGNLA
jgi:TP901 family phage tail tape measure protein